MLNGERPGFGGLVRIGGPEKGKVRHGAESGKLFHGLMRGTVFAEPDAVVRKYIDDFQTAERA